MTGPRVIDAASLLEREHELDALDGALAAAAGGAGEIVLVHGPPTHSVPYTAPGPRQAQPVLNALRDPRTVTYVRPR